MIGIERVKLVHETGVYGNEMRNFVHEMWLPGGSGFLSQQLQGAAVFNRRFYFKYKRFLTAVKKAVKNRFTS